MNYNKVMMAGNLTSDPDSKEVIDGALRKLVTNFVIAVNSRSRGHEEVLFMRCAAWGRTAEIVRDHFKKGSPIFVEGRLKEDRWNDKEGNQHRAVRLVVQELKFVGKKDLEPKQEEPAF